jgi:sporulation protein YlmC with PRC-barrel domain
MKRLNKILAITTITGVALGFSPPAQAADQEQNQSQVRRDQTHIGSDKINVQSARASKLIGADLKSSQNETIGEIHDLIVDTDTGNIKHVVVSAGGVLGIGDKLVLVPASQFRSATEGTHLTLQMDKERLKRSPEFKADQYMTFMESQESESRTTLTPTGRETSERAYSENRKETVQTGKKSESWNKHGVRASKLIGMDLYNQQNEDFAEVNDLIVDLQAGKMKYAIIAVGGVMGVGDRLVALPAAQFKTSYRDDKLFLNAERDRLSNAPEFKESDFTNNPDWDRSTRDYFSSADLNREQGEVNLSPTGVETTERRYESDRSTYERRDQNAKQGKQHKAYRKESRKETASRSQTSRDSNGNWLTRDPDYSSNEGANDMVGPDRFAEYNSRAAVTDAEVDTNLSPTGKESETVQRSSRTEIQKRESTSMKADSRVHDTNLVEFRNKIRDDSELAPFANNVSAVRRDDGSLVLRGTVNTEAQRDEILEIAQDCYPNANIKNEIRVTR